MGLFIFRFWPVVIPLLIYWMWLVVVRRRAAKAGQQPPGFRDGPWYWAVLASLLTAVGCFLYLGFTVSRTDSLKGQYVPPHVENNRLVPGHVEP